MKSKWDKLDNWTQIIVVLSIALVGLAAFAGWLKSINDKPSPPEDFAVVSVWDTGAVTVTTSVDCINSIDDDVILIADPDSDFDEIAKQIMEMQDVGDE